MQIIARDLACTSRDLIVVDWLKEYKRPEIGSPPLGGGDELNSLSRGNSLCVCIVERNDLPQPVV